MVTVPTSGDSQRSRMLTAVMVASRQPATSSAPEPVWAKVTRASVERRKAALQAEPGEAKRAYHKVIARDVLPFGVRLKRCLAPLDGRFGGRLLRNGSRGRDHQEYGEGDNRETDDDEQDE